MCQLLAAAGGPRTTDCITTTIVEAVAEASSEDRVARAPPLYRTIDPEAIDALCAHAARSGTPADGSVTFDWCGCAIEVSFAGDVSVAPAEPAGDGADRRAGSLDRCATCGRRLTENVAHPVRNGRDDEGAVVLSAFCDRECRRRHGWDG